MLTGLYINDVPIECVNQAAIVYHIPATLLISILKVENGRVGMATKNTNGTFDYGPMQINSLWVDIVKPYGYSRERLQYDPCTNIWIGTWILSKKIAESTSLWRGIANYHSHTEGENIAYQYKVWNAYKNVVRYLATPTSDTKQT